MCRAKAAGGLGRGVTLTPSCAPTHLLLFFSYSRAFSLSRSHVPVYVFLLDLSLQRDPSYAFLSPRTPPHPQFVLPDICSFCLLSTCASSSSRTLFVVFFSSRIRHNPSLLSLSLGSRSFLVVTIALWTKKAFLAT